MYSVHSILYRVHSILYSVHSTLYSVHSILYSVHSILYNVLYIVQSNLNTLVIQYSTVNIVSGYQLEMLNNKSYILLGCAYIFVFFSFVNIFQTYLYNKRRHSYIYLLRIAAQTARPIGLTFFVDNQGCPGSVIGDTKLEILFSFFLAFFTGNAAGPTASFT